MINDRVIMTSGLTLHCIGDDRLAVWPSPDGPLLVRGAAMIIDQDGVEHPAKRPVVALCRCGSSIDQPWCDGMHKLLQRRDRSRRRDPADGVCAARTPGTRSIRTSTKETAMGDEETGGATGTADKDYNIIWYTEKCLSNALRLERFISDAERAGDQELADFFRKAQADSRKGAEAGKQLLAARLGG